MCGQQAIVNHERNIYICKICKGDADIREIPSCWAVNLACNEIKAMNIGMRFHLKPYRLEMLEKDANVIQKKLESVIETE